MLTKKNIDVTKKKKLAWGICSSKPISLNVSPGDQFPLEYIMLGGDPLPSVVKDFQAAFRDNYVCISMLPMSSHHVESSFIDAMILMDVYKHIQSFGGKFEVICVPTRSPAQNVLNDEDFKLYMQLNIESCTSFSHVPINEIACLERIAKTIGLPQETTYVIVGPMKDRRVVSIFDSDFLHWHGAEAYPFTAKKIQQLAREDEALLSAKYDLATLLSTPCRNFVISNDCGKVPISDLQHKTVCLLFYEDNCEGKKRTEELKHVYEARKDFEVVVVFAITFGHDTGHLVGRSGKLRSELKFWKVFCDMPWLAVPFDDPKCRQLWRIFNRTKICNDSYAPKLIIINSEGKYFEENGFQVLDKTRFEGYPFTRKSTVRGSKLCTVRWSKLSSVFGRDVELVRNKAADWLYSGIGQEKYIVSELFGASVVLFFIGAPFFKELLWELKNFHYYSSTTLSRFEVVYVPLMESLPCACSWMLVSPSEFNKECLIPLFNELFKDEITQNSEKEFTLALVTFGPFGHYFKRGIIFTTSFEEADQLFDDTFPLGNNKNEEVIKSQCAMEPSYLPTSGHTGCCGYEGLDVEEHDT